MFIKPLPSNGSIRHNMNTGKMFVLWDVAPRSLVHTSIFIRLSRELTAFTFGVDYSTLKMEVTSSSEILLNICHGTWCHIPENNTLQGHHRSNLRSDKRIEIFKFKVVYMRQRPGTSAFVSIFIYCRYKSTAAVNIIQSILHKTKLAAQRTNEKHVYYISWKSKPSFVVCYWTLTASKCFK
jgi:hypothetical protein